jgi:hypothetical protein
MDDNTIKEQQVAIAERLQLKWLKRMETLLDAGEITSTDMATLVRFLMANGWTLDPSRLPSKLKDKLTTSMSPEDFDAQADVLPFNRKQA